MGKAKRWGIKLKQGLMSGVALDEQSRVAVVSDNKGSSLVLDRMTGKVIWQTPLDTVTLSPPSSAETVSLPFGNDGKITALSLLSLARLFGLLTPKIQIWRSR